MFRPVPADADFVSLEEEELARWREHQVFERSVAQRQGAEPWVFYEGPPTANGRPGPAPRVGPGLQGPLLPLPHHARLPGSPPGRLGHPRPAGGGGGRKAARDHRQATDRRGGRHRRVHPPVPRVGARLRRGLATADRAHRLLGRPGRRLLDVRPRLRPVGLVAPEAPLRPGPALRGPEGRPLLPALRHRPLQPRARPARRLRRRGGRVGLRPAAPGRPGPGPGGVAGRGRGHLAGGLDHHPVDAAVQHRGGRPPRPGLRGGGRHGGGRGTGRGGLRRRGHRHPAAGGAGAGGAALPAPVRRR